MKRRRFIKNLFCVSFCAGLAEQQLNAGIYDAVSAATAKNDNKTLRFGLITDLHQDVVQDADKRLEAFLKAARKNEVDFVIDLGDFAMVKEENKPFANIWREYKGEKYNVLGNHDMDNCTKEQFMEFVGMKSRYYSFDKGDYHFVVLDANNIYDGEKYIPYANANFYIDSKKRAWVDPEQIEWLKDDLQKTDKRCVIFSHQSIENAISNKDVVMEVLDGENKRAGYTKIVAALSGHDHTDYHKEINGIVYVQINSASYYWVGDKYENETRFSEEVYKKRPGLKYTVTYEDPLFAMVTLKKNSMKIDGVKSKFTNPTPQELNMPDNPNGVPLVATISDVVIKF